VTLRQIRPTKEFDIAPVSLFQHHADQFHRCPRRQTWMVPSRL
jgi:hypothetical protein